MVAPRDHPGPPEHASRPREALPLGGRALAVEAGVAAAFVVAASLLAALGHGHVRWDVAVVLTVCLAFAVRAQFDIGSGYAPPTQLVFVPALLLEPPSVAPLIAMCGWAAGRIPDLVHGELHPSRLLLKVPSNCWFAIGPAVVLELADVHGPAWGDWALYLAALAAQFAGDLLSGTVREWLQIGVPPRLQLRSLLFVWLIDAALAPVGLLAAFASVGHRFAFVGVMPLAALLVIFSRERTRRFEAELAAVRSREALIAGASHEIQTPLSVLSGLIEGLAHSPDLSAERRAEGFSSMRRQAGQLSHLAGQFIDYAGLKAGQRLTAAPRPTEISPALGAVAVLWEYDVAGDAPADLRALVDPSRLHAVLMALVSNALKHGPPGGPVRLTAHRENGRVLIEVTDTGEGLVPERLEAVFDELDVDAGRTEGSGLGLFLARTAMREQGGDVRLRAGAAGGLVAIVDLPAGD